MCTVAGVHEGSRSVHKSEKKLMQLWSVWISESYQKYRSVHIPLFYLPGTV